MSNKCPKCGAKLSPFYLKPNCPSCGVNIVQYGFDERLESDKIRAEKEWERTQEVLHRLAHSNHQTHIVFSADSRTADTCI